MTQVDQAKMDAPAAADMAPAPAAGRRFGRRTCLCASVAVLMPLVLTIATLVGEFPAIKPTHLTVDASESGQTVRGLLEADYVFAWSSLGQLHKPELRDIACQIHVGDSPALSVHLTEVNQDEKGRIKVGFEIADVSPRHIVPAIEGADGTGVRCNIDMALNVWSSGIAITRSFVYETSPKDTSNIEMVKHGHNVTHPTRENMNATMVTNYTIEWSLSGSSAIVEFLRTTPVYIKADAGIVELRKRSVMGFIGVDSYILLKELEDGGLHASLPLKTGARLDIPAITGVISDAMIDTTNGLAAGHGREDVMIDLAVTPEGAPLGRLLGSRHKLNISTTRSEIGQDAVGHGGDHGGRLLKEYGGFYQTHRMNFDGTNLMGIDIRVVNGEPFEIGCDVFQTFFENETDNWVANFSFFADEDMVELAMKSRASPELTINASVKLDMVAERFNAHAISADGLHANFTVDKQRELARAVFIYGQSANITLHMDVPGQMAHLGVDMDDFSLRAGIDGPAETAMFSLRSPDANMSGSIDAAAKSVVAGGIIKAGDDNITLDAAGDFNGDGVGHFLLSHPNIMLLGNYSRTGSVAPASPETIVLALLMQETLGSSQEHDGKHLTGTSSSYNASLHMSATMSMTKESHSANTTHRLGVGLLMEPKCIDLGGSATVHNVNCTWRQYHEGGTYTDSTESCCKGAMPIEMDPGLANIGYNWAMSGLDLRMVEYPNSNDMTMMGYIDIADPAAPKARVDYHELGNSVYNVSALIDISDTENVAAMLQWEDGSSVFTAAARALHSANGEILAATLSYDHGHPHVHRINGTLATEGNHQGSALVIVEDHPHLAAGSVLVTNSTWQEMMSGGLSWMDEQGGKIHTIRGNASESGAPLGHGLLSLEDTPQAKKSRVLLSDSSSPMFDMNATATGSGLMDMTLNVSEHMKNDGEPLEITFGAITMQPLCSFDLEVLNNHTFALGSHGEVTHPDRIFYNDANRVLKMRNPFAASAWLDGEENRTRKRIGDMSWNASDSNDVVSSRMVVRNGSAHDIIVWTASFDDSSGSAVDILSNVTFDGSPVLGLTASLPKDSKWVAGELLVYADGATTPHSVYVNASSGFHIPRTRPTGFDMFHIAFGSVIEGNQANLSGYLERGPDLKPSGFGYRVAIFNGTGASKTAMYEGTGDIDLVPGQAPINPNVAVTPVSLVLEVADITTFSTADMVAVIAQAAGADPSQVIIESVTAEVTTTYAVDSTVSPQDLRRAVALQFGLPLSQVSVRPAAGGGGRRLAAVSYDVVVETQDFEMAARVANEAEDTAALTTALHEVNPAAPPPTVVTAPSTQVVMQTSLVSNDATPLAVPPQESMSTALTEVLGPNFGGTLRTGTTTLDPDASTTVAGMIEGGLSGATGRTCAGAAWVAAIAAALSQA